MGTAQVASRVHGPILHPERPGQWKAFSLFFAFAGAVALEEVFQLFLEFAYVFEVSIDGREPDICHRVEALEVLHDQFANFAGGALTLGCIDEIAFSGVHHLFRAGWKKPAASRTRATGR